MACELLKRLTVKCVFSPIFRRLSVFVLAALFPQLLIAGFQGLPTSPSLKPSFTTYMQMLLDNKIVGTADLVRLVEGLEGGVLENPITAESMEVDSNRRIHHKGLADIMAHSKVDHSEVLRWANQSLQERKEVQVKREEARVETQSLAQDATSNLILYLEQSFASRIIGEAHLRKLSEGLKKRTLVNPISLEEAIKNGSILFLHRETIDSFLKYRIDMTELDTWLDEKLRDMQASSLACAQKLCF